MLYAWDTYGISNSLAGSITKAGKKNWYFLTVDYALGQAIEKDAMKAIGAAGGTVVGSRKHPSVPPTSRPLCWPLKALVPTLSRLPTRAET